MKPPKPMDNRWVWRISRQAPLGEWVDLDAPPPPRIPAAPSELPEVSTGGWIVSSFDLLRGAEVDTSGDTIPDALFDELFPAKKGSA